MREYFKSDKKKREESKRKKKEEKRNRRLGLGKKEEGPDAPPADAAGLPVEPTPNA